MKDTYFRFRLSEEERETAERLAAASGENLSVYIRRLFREDARKAAGPLTDSERAQALLEEIDRCTKQLQQIIR